MTGILSTPFRATLTITMADVEMTDAPTAVPVAKKKGGADGEGKEGKKRFEVKKVRQLLAPCRFPAAR